MASKIAYGQKSNDLMTEVREELKRERGGSTDICALVDRMRRDPYVRLVERDIRASVATAQVSVSTASPDPKAKVIAMAMEDLWQRNVGKMLDCYAYGRVAFEVVWHNVRSYVTLVQRLEPLPHGRTEPLIDKQSEDSGRPSGVILKGKTDETKPLDLPAPYGWWLALDASWLNPEGESRFAGAMEESFEMREELKKRIRTFCRKYALGDLVVFADQMRKDHTGRDVDQWEEIAEQVRDMEGGDLLTFPNDMKEDPGGASRKAIEVDRSQLGARDGSPLINMAKELGSEILLAAAIPPRTVLEGDSGSFALVTWQMLVKFAVVEDILYQIGNQFTQSIIRPAETFNGIGPSVDWNFVPLTQRPDDLIAELAKAWLTNPALSPLIASGKVDVRKVLEMSGIPISDKANEFLSGVNLAPPAAPLVQMAAPSFRQWR